MVNYVHNTFLYLCISMFSIASCEAIAEGADREDKELQTQKVFVPKERGFEGDSQASPQENSVIIIDKLEGQTKVRVDTKGHVSPYLGTSKRPPPPKEVMHIISKEEQDRNLRSFHLETGIGVKVDKNINFDLGYRFEHTPSLTDEYEQDNEQIRFGIKFKY